MIDVLERILPRTRTIEIENAGHMRLFTRRQDIGKGISAHFDWLDELRQSNASG